ncbi:four helix bundle protein [Polaribacter sp. Q13]|uniref:four helix bundle protein n=1 Tax=Polaribacter sp. Q13 TaxID=2806551 RepID=UPI00193B3823|nr:four helix bundle protein [Polaribacter sp. Q13]QVY67427.1 four helix bundle protein [Polaribacter sp. Q13]
MKSLEIRILFLDIKISRKEAKESILWLRLLRDMNQEFTTEFEKMIQECDELRKILSAIINKA